MARYVRKVLGSSSDFEPSTLTTLMRMSSLYELITNPSLQILHSNITFTLQTPPPELPHAAGDPSVVDVPGPGDAEPRA